MKSGVLNVCFKITNRVNIRYTSKLLLALTSDCKENMIAFFYPFDLFKSLLIIQISCNSFQDDGGKGFVTIVNVNPESMQITIFSNIFSGAIIYHIAMFYLKLFKICLNINQ